MLEVNVPECQLSQIPMCRAMRELFKVNGVHVVSRRFPVFGFETVKFIVQKGSCSVAILLRQNPTSEQLKEMQFLESQNEGNRIISLWCNVGFHSEMEKAINAIGNIFSKNEI